MKRTHKRLTRLLSAGMSLALLTTLLPGALAASRYTMDGYEVDSNQDLEIDADDFYDFFDDYAEDPYDDDIYAIYFEEVPSKSEGDLYYYDGNKEYDVEVDEEIRWKNFDTLLFVPDEDCDDTVSINFELETYEEYIRGTLEIEVYADSSSSSGDVTYETDVNDEVYLDVDDFDDYVYDSTRSGDEVDYIYFTSLPSSSKGTLYYDGTRSSDEVGKNDDFDHDEIDDLLFIPDDDFEGTVTIPFKGEADSGESISGDLVIVVGDGKSSSAKEGDVTYNIDVNDEVYLDVDDFDDYVYDSTRSGDEVDYIYFTSLPSSSKGTLYYDGTRSSDEVGKNDDFDHDEIDDLLFIPDDDYEGSVTIPFKGEADSGESISGDLVINVGIGGDAEVVVKLNASTGNPITFDADDFNDAVMDETGYNLNYVVFDYASGRGGYLYFDYDGASEGEVDDARYYRSSSPSLNDVTFVPGSAAGSTTRIPFKAYTTNNKTVNGEVEITYVTLSSPSVVSYTSNGLAVTFRSSDFAAACAARGGSSLVSVTFPSASVTGGQLYYGFETPTNYQRGILSTVSYSYGSSGLYRLDEVTFLPKAEYTGSVVIPYVGTDADGITYNGNIQITVTPPSSTTRFNDMGNYSWAVPGVEFLAAYGITTGTGTGTTYSPASQLTRGDYILMLVRTFNLTASSTGNFSDVKADAYYADALAVAKALGIATADANGNFRPTEGVTRQDAMVFLYRAMQKANRTVPNAYDSYLTRFPDGASVATDARPAMAAMAQAGVIKGDQAGRLNPTGTLTRAEMATILHRALTL